LLRAVIVTTESIFVAAQPPILEIKGIAIPFLLSLALVLAP
jgi:hypothetical protein